MKRAAREPAIETTACAEKNAIVMTAAWAKLKIRFTFKDEREANGKSTR